MSPAGSRRAIFLDRDGTLNEERGFITDPSEVEVLPGVPEALERLAAAGFRLVVVTNQSGIARGLYTEANLAAVHAELHRRLGGLPDAYFHCPHHPEVHDSGIQADRWSAWSRAYRLACACRKPGGGLYRQAARILGLDLAGSFAVGDSARDVLAASTLPVPGVLVQTGKPWREQLAELERAGVEPWRVCADLGEAADAILGGQAAR